MDDNYFWYDTKIRKKMKWRKIYAKDCNQAIYEGFTLNNKPGGMETTYYTNSSKHPEGIFDIKCFIQGKEYYSNGQLRFVGTCRQHEGYGPNYPLNENYYDENCELKYSCLFEVVNILYKE